ncbi:cell division cycle protein 123 homolog isoform X1 [Stegodyphus dumicola]|uniref:cell division cycle protein 123 homolog isoform X1 n=1 Tax=Stegodyphus dumicola TaxID=202533 RepID=UPI0015A95399|nr:cell division cycle protein 123 homolog isoform X1 [Stegodyphus dumicola]
MKIKDVEVCSFQNWYNDFKHVTFKSIILALPEGFVSYILKDGIVLPENCQTNSAVKQTTTSDESDDEQVSWEDGEADEAEAPHFSEFDARIKYAIESLGGKVFPKLNWSSPRDASWIAFNNCCCCTTVSDIYLLLKSSDFIVYDLTKVFSHCEDFINSNDLNRRENGPYYLVLRKWIDIDTSGEYRCFVKDNSLIGISQREHSLYFHHINNEKEEIVEDINNFFIQHIQSKFPCSNYVFDVYRKKKDHVYLVDFNPFGTVTESLLFDWDELIIGTVGTNGTSLPEFRYVDDDRGVQPRPLSYHAIPRDIVDISTGEDSFKLVDLIKLEP